MKLKSPASPLTKQPPDVMAAWHSYRRSKRIHEVIGAKIAARREARLTEEVCF